MGKGSVLFRPAVSISREKPLSARVSSARGVGDFRGFISWEGLPGSLLLFCL